MNNFVGNLDKTFTWMALFLLGCAGVVIGEQWILWGTRVDYSFGYLVPFFCLYVLYDRWPQIKEILFAEKKEPVPPPPPCSKLWDVPVFIVLFTGLLIFGLGASMRIVNGPNIPATYLNTGGFTILFLGIAWLLSEKNTNGRALSFKERLDFLALFVFPALVWIISGPFHYFVDTRVKIHLLGMVTSAVVATLTALDFSVTGEGNTILMNLPGGQVDRVGIADACSGIISLTACVFMGAFLGATFIQGLLRKLILLGLSLVFAIVLNILRTSFLALWAYKHGSNSLDFDLWGNAAGTAGFTLGSVHDIAGYVAMGITLLLLVALLPFINFRLTRSDEDMLELTERKD
ncbi:MAG: exosortase/archaeosortase family protein [Puniceicoccales bacterium]|nr:exosortase/archaeosortase family protein [Puniceicoccales bacterium]